MNSLFRRVGAAVFLALIMAGIGQAQQADSVGTRGALPGRGGIGGQIGSSYIFGGTDYKGGAQPRFSFIGHFRYQASRTWGWQVSPYFTWNGYVSHALAPYKDLNFPTEGRSKEFYLTQVVGAAGEIQWFHGTGGQRWHLGAGPGIYRVVIENHRKVLKDPLSLELHSSPHLAATAEFGVERFLKKLPNTTIEVTAAMQEAFSRDDKKFPSGWNANPMLIELRAGAHYYYDFRRGKPAPKAPPRPARPAKK